MSHDRSQERCVPDVPSRFYRFNYFPQTRHMPPPVKVSLAASSCSVVVCCSALSHLCHCRVLRTLESPVCNWTVLREEFRADRHSEVACTCTYTPQHVLQCGSARTSQNKDSLSNSHCCEYQPLPASAMPCTVHCTGLVNASPSLSGHMYQTHNDCTVQICPVYGPCPTLRNTKQHVHVELMS